MTDKKSPGKSKAKETTAQSNSGQKRGGAYKKSGPTASDGVQEGSAALVGKESSVQGITLPEIPLERQGKLLAAVSYDWNDDSRGYDLVRVIREGIDYKTFETVAAKTPLKDKDWATVLDTTSRTLIRYKKDNKTFGPKQTERIIEIQQLMQYGEEVFGDLRSFHTWLMTKNVALGGISPKALLDTSVGLGMVKDTLGRIEHGILA